MDGAIIVVAATDGPMPQNSRAHPFGSSGKRSEIGCIHEQV